MPASGPKMGAVPAKTKPTDVADALAALKAKATKRTLTGMARYGIPSDHAWGVSVADIRQLGKRLGPDHALAAALWSSGVYEARMLAAFVEQPEKVTVAQMDRWCRDFDNWAICDTLCFHLFDRTPHAFGRVQRWSTQQPEFVKRAAFALLASLGRHDKVTGDGPFLACLPLIERAAQDPRNFVMKGVNWALRVLGARSEALKAEALAVAQRLAKASDPAPRWVGSDAVRQLGRAKKPAAKATKRKR
jgi:3-methyladenine DNA glycosylase AlkD